MMMRPALAPRGSSSSSSSQCSHSSSHSSSQSLHSRLAWKQSQLSSFQVPGSRPEDEPQATAQFS